jgi:hypothetical protein
LRSNDLDPIYVALRGALDAGEFDAGTVNRWMIAYWCFYNAGFASYACDRNPADFWATLANAAANTSPTPFGGRWPRGAERRHARGGQAVEMIGRLIEEYGDHPGRMVDNLLRGDRAFSAVSKRVRKHYLFGPWIAFKIGDMLERVLGERIDFDNADVFMFDSPREGALLVYGKFFGDDFKVKEPERIRKVVHWLTAKFSEFNAPPLGDRRVGLQEIETILCKWKSHLNGHYPLNNDIHEIREGLKPWIPHSRNAAIFESFMPEPLHEEE